MTMESEELESIGRALPRETISELSRLTRVVPPETFSAMLGMFRAVPADAIRRMALPDVGAASGVLGSKLPYLQLSVLQRAMRAVTVSFDGFDQEELSKIAAEETDAEVLFELVVASRLLEALEEKDPLAEARLEGIEEQRRLVREAGGAVGAAEVGEILGGISRQAVDARRKKGRLLAIGNTGGRRGWRYPLCQFDESSEDGVVRGLDGVIAAVEDPSGWMVLAFLLSPEERLGDERPLDVLRRGEVEGVQKAAMLYGEHIAY